MRATQTTDGNRTHPNELIKRSSERIQCCVDKSRSLSYLRTVHHVLAKPPPHIRRKPDIRSDFQQATQRHQHNTSSSPDQDDSWAKFSLGFPVLFCETQALVNTRPSPNTHFRYYCVMWPNEDDSQVDSFRRFSVLFGKKRVPVNTRLSPNTHFRYYCAMWPGQGDWKVAKGKRRIQPLVPIRCHSVPFGAIRSHSFPFAATRSHSFPFAATRSHSQPLAAIRSHSVSFAAIRKESKALGNYIDSIDHSTTIGHLIEVQ